ncbi:hypothetical protein ACFVXC_17610 [Streptomyces sp. NPDC058257]|uniref:hypothetical protein n=1 Tax=Streptomyces sp. NPDC058257 TaxID=3346409 RepID=UPI0036F078B4
MIGNFYPQGKGEEFRDGLLRHIEGRDESKPMFIAAAINAWSWSPSDIAELAELLDAPFEVVRGDVFFALMNLSA